MNKAVAWLEEGYDSAYERARERSRKYNGEMWIVDRNINEYTSYFCPLHHNDLYNPFYTIKEDL